MSDSKYRISEFNLIGQLIGFVIKDGSKIKYLRLVNSEQEYWIKPSNYIRHNLDPAIVPGTWLEIHGTRKLSLKTGTIKLKADSIKLQYPPNLAASNLLVPQQSCPQAKILVCQKSSCWKRGGKEVCQALEKYISDRGLESQVQIKTTGCLKQCKYAPNLVMMPDKKRYSQIQAQDIPGLLEKYIPQQFREKSTNTIENCPSHV